MSQRQVQLNIGLVDTSGVAEGKKTTEVRAQTLAGN